MTDTLLTIAETGKRFSLHRTSIYKLIQAGRLTAKAIPLAGKRKILRIAESEL